MSNDERNPNLNRLSSEFTDGAETGEFNSNELQHQNRTGWDSSRNNQNPSGPLTDIGEGRSGQQSDQTNDFEERKDDDYQVTTSWDSGKQYIPDIETEGKSPAQYSSNSRPDSGADADDSQRPNAWEYGRQTKPNLDNELDEPGRNPNNTVAGGGSEFTGSNEGLRDRNFDRDDIGSDPNRNKGTGLVGTHDLSDAADDMDDEEDELQLDNDDDDMEDEVSNDYDDELGNPPSNSF